MVEEARLESVYIPKGYHEFESRSLRNWRAGVAYTIDGTPCVMNTFVIAALEGGFFSDCLRRPPLRKH